MDARLIAVAAFVVLLSGCSSVSETADFLSSPVKPATGAKFATRDLKSALDPDAPIPPTVGVANEVGKSPEADKVADTQSAAGPSPEVVAASPDTDVAKATADPVTAAAAEPKPGTGLFAFFTQPDKPTAAEIATETETATPEAEPAGTKAIAPQAADPEKAVAEPAAPVEDAPDEVSEAELAGEEEADPTKIAVPEEPFNDGLEHDFVNVYSSRPEKTDDAAGGLPGVDWPGGLGVASLGSGDDDGRLFGGEDHPFARTVPGIPQRVIQAANGLLLANSSINVNCIKPNLLNLVRRAETNFGHKVVITSGYRSPAHNRRVHGATHSQHMFCNALDLYMPGVSRDELARFFFTQPDRGGLGLYCHTRSIHVDTGRRRQWRWSCRRRAG